MAEIYNSVQLIVLMGFPSAYEKKGLKWYFFLFPIKLCIFGLVGDQLSKTQAKSNRKREVLLEILTRLSEINSCLVFKYFFEMFEVGIIACTEYFRELTQKILIGLLPLPATFAQE